MVLSSGPCLTQEDILSLPRPLPPVVNPSGTFAIWPSSTFSFKLSKTFLSFHLIDIRGGGQVDEQGKEKEKEKKKVLLKDQGLDNLQVCWLDDQTIVFTIPTRPDCSAEQEEIGNLNDEEYKALKSSWKKGNEGGIQGTGVIALNVETKEEYCLGQFPVP